VVRRRSSRPSEDVVNDLDVEGLVGSVLRGVLGGRRKRSRGALRYLAGGGRSSFLNASTLLTLAGVAWGVWETVNQGGAAATPSGAAPGAVPGAVPATTSPAGGLASPPPIPAGAGLAMPPPLPGTPLASPLPAVPPHVVQVLRLTLAAARADGTLDARERDAILARAREVGAEAIIAGELDAPRPLDEIVAGAAGAAQAPDLYTLAFAIVRADETVSDAERAWLTSLAGHLGLDPATVSGLEQRAAERIAAAAEGAQH
jgi:Protein of unknown function (DUF533)